MGYAPFMLRNAIARLQETHLATRLDRWMTGATIALLVAVGFLVGRWTSRTSNATPIVFQEAPGGSSAASPEELQALVAGAAATASPVPPEAPLRQDFAGQASPGARQPTPASRPLEKPAGAYVASASGTKYYFQVCPEVKRIKEENLVWFDSEEEAKESGYEPSQCVLRKK